MSPAELHVYAWTHTPPWQFVEQHSDPAAQALPSVVQLETVGLTTWHWPPLQIPEQHWLAEVQLAPVLAHAAAAQWLVPSQRSEQHSHDEVQATPASLQNAD